MGATSSKAERSEALRLCKERKRFIKAAIDSRYNFAASHVAYIQSLKNIGVALRHFAEAQVINDSCLSTDVDKTMSPSSYPSLSPSHNAAAFDSPLPAETPVERLSYMRSGGTSVVTVSVSLPSSAGYVDDNESMSFPVRPPPPPFHDSASTWDYFDPTDESFSFIRQNMENVDFDDVKMYGQMNERDGEVDVDNGDSQVGKKEQQVSCSSTPPSDRLGRAKSEGSDLFKAQQIRDEVRVLTDDNNMGGSAAMLSGRAAAEQSGSTMDKALVGKATCSQREDPSDFITHRAKDFLSSIKDIENRFFRASECGREVSRMLEANKIRIGYSEAGGKSSGMGFLEMLTPNCCGGAPLVSHEHSRNVTKVITWNRSTSARSSSSRSPLATASKDDNDDSGSEFAEEFCMIAGSHSSTLDRMYAWERKLYDEVKASECIRKEYDRKCDQLRHQFAKDLSSSIIDKTRSVIKDLHSRTIVALHAVDSIAKRIEKMRDEELLPQLIELVQGLVRMWKAMLECHHAQYITISLAYHAKNSTRTPQGVTKQEIMDQLQHEMECFGLSFADWINSHNSYVQALNGWLQNCIMQPREKSKGRRAFSPRRVVAPPIIVLGRDWCAGIQNLPSEELNEAIKSLLYDLRHSVEHQEEEPQNKQPILDTSGNIEADVNEVNSAASSNLSSIHSSLTKVLDRLTKFSEASLKMYEDIRQKNETARNAYMNYRPPRSISL
ncbi:hypothetical protein DCAR_0311380 [Daucus carota subsp. sativus]|uniref:DUF632 domain-containing protein n=1 Tax=Daucus carota subsp. sativus TaxID=79200 RepID=A0A166AJ06_DAUCS|nr:PREDICTED: uncharacterized protein LOC108210869 [Daucus carota subsp. sativus]WOG92121.1 hypothetical protein DCAR_0311380 [Daucus carota subsp. sativus]